MRQHRVHRAQQHHRKPIVLAVIGALSGATGAAHAADQSPDALEEIIVTATRRAESVIDIPYNISAVSGEKLEEALILDTVDLVRTVPAVSVVDRGYRNSGVINGIIIRGLNTNGAALGDYALSGVPSVSTYIDDTPIYANFVLDDIERVEILRGPQGTLYGSGALGGTLRYIMRAPSPEEFAGSVGVTGTSVHGSDGEGWAAKAMVNIPMGERAALRVSGGKLDYPGLVDYVNVYQLDSNGIPVAPNGLAADDASYRVVKDADSVDIEYGRVALLLTPNDAWRIQLSGQIQSDDIGGRRQVTRGDNGLGQPYGEYENGSIQLEPSSKDVHLGALEVNVDLGFASVTSSSSYYDHDGDSISENTGFYAQNGWLDAFYYNYPRPMASASRTYADRAFVQELRLVSQGENTLDYVFGLYYQDQTQRSTQVSRLVGFKQWWDNAFAPGFEDAVISDVDFDYARTQTFKEKAAYGELTWHVSTTFSLTGGLRYFDNEFDNDTSITVGLYDGFIFDDDPQFSNSDDDVLYKVNAAWDFADQHMMYGTISQGYRRGGTNAVPTEGAYAESPAFQEYDPDSVTNYEVGVKGRAGAVQYSLAAFFIDWEDVQLESATPNGGFFVVVNGEGARSQGLEAELHGAVGSAFNYSLGYTYVDAELTDPLCSPHVTKENCLANPNNSFRMLAQDGATLPGAAEHTFNVAADYTFEIANGWRWISRVLGYYQSETENAIGSSDRFRQTLDSFQLWNLYTTLANDSWDVTLFAKNVFNEEGVTGLFKEEYMGTDFSQNYLGNGSKEFISLPRTFGVAVNFRF